MKQMLVIASLLLVLSSFGMDLSNLQTNTFVQVTPITHEFPEGYTGVFQRRFWCNFTWDSDSSRIIFYEGYGGSHGQTGGSIYANAIYSFTPADSKVRMLNLSNWDNPSYDHHVARTGEATPHPRHTYGGFKYVSKYKSIFLGLGACAHDVTCTSADIWQYNFSNKSWTEIGKPLPADGQIGETNYTSQFAHFNGSDTLWIFAPRRDASGWLNIYSFNLSTHEWSAKLNYGTSVANMVHLSEDTLRKQILLWTNNGGNKFWYFQPLSGLLTQLPAPPTALQTTGKIVYLSKYDRYLIYDKARVWSLNPNDTTWSEVASANIPGTRFDDYFAYDPVNDVIAMFDINGAYWVYRYLPSNTGGELHHSAEKLKLTVLPNPARMWVEIQSSDMSTIFNVFNLAGQCIATGAGSKWRWNTTEIATGIYTIRAASGKKVKMQKLIVTN